MDPRLQASFIPKKPLMEHSAVAATPRQSVGLFSVLAWIIFVISLCLALGVFLYNLYLNNSITNLTNTINTTEQEYAASSATLATYSRMDDRLKTASELLNAHIAASPIFAFLEQNTAQNVRLNSFTFAYVNGATPGTPNSVDITLSGEAKSFNSLGVQDDVFSGNPIVQNPVVSNIGLDADGNVTFSLAATIAPGSFAYSSVLASSTAANTSAGAPADTPAAGSAFQ